MPKLTGLILAGLPGFGGVDPDQSDALTVDLDAVAIDDRGAAGNLDLRDSHKRPERQGDQDRRAAPEPAAGAMCRRLRPLEGRGVRWPI